MSLGPTMKLRTSTGMHIELAPFTRDDCKAFVEGFSKESVTQYLEFHASQTFELEQKWYDKMVENKTCYAWGIWVVENGERKLIGNTAINDIDQKHIIQATTGSVITDTAYWGKGIASAAHKARTWYAFRKYGLIRLKSAVLQTNTASRKALEKSGYDLVYVERCVQFKDGGLVHQDCLECLNPDDWAWRQWWGNDRPTRKAIESRAKTLEVLDWAEQNVELL